MFPETKSTNQRNKSAESHPHPLHHLESEANLERREQDATLQPTAAATRSSRGRQDGAPQPPAPIQSGTYATAANEQPEGRRLAASPTEKQRAERCREKSAAGSNIARANHLSSISETSEDIYSTNLLLNAKVLSATRYNQNVSLMRSILINYLKLTLCSCYDTLALATLLVFMLFLNNFIEAHQHHQTNSSQQTTRKFSAPLRVGQLGFWSGPSRGANQTDSTGTWSRSSTSRPRRSIERVVLGLPFVEADQQQRQLAELEESPETILEAGSSLRPALQVARPFERLNYRADISRMVSAGGNSSAETEEPQLPAPTNSQQSSLAPPSNCSDHKFVASRTTSSERNYQGSQRRFSPVASHRLESSEQQVDARLTAANRVPDWSFRQALTTTSSTTTTTTTTRKPYFNDQRRAQSATGSRLPTGDGQWIPITAESAESRPRRFEPGAGNKWPEPETGSYAASALLDYPADMKEPEAHLRETSDPLMPINVHATPELWHLGSFGYGNRYPNYEYQTRPRAPLGPSYELVDGYRHKHHWRWPGRRPRFQNELDNEIEHAPLKPSKIYKRVLLCDKTLVSLDYIRNLDLEPRPSALSGQLLNENEINEISNSFLDLENGIETSMSRLNLIFGGSDASGNAIRKRSVSNSTFSSRRVSRLLASGLNKNAKLKSSNTSGLFDDVDRAQDQVASMSMAAPERRYSGQSLLSDDDPLVRCDMWDLEKGLKSRKPPLHILRMAIKADFETVRDAINRCRQLSEKTLPPEDEYRDGPEIMSTEDLVSLFSMKRGLMPGTKWCGLGDQADSYNDLGPKYRIDICCRAHDHCPIRSKPFRNDYGILNIGLYTKSHCDCDADFYRCLREVRSRTADMLGNLYFNVMKLQCMREERRKVCREMKPTVLGFERCIRYEESPVHTVFKFTTPPVAY